MRWELIRELAEIKPLCLMVHWTKVKQSAKPHRLGNVKYECRIKWPVEDKRLKE